MKLKTIASLFKRNKRLTVFNAQNGEQWLCNGIAMYSMRGMPEMTPEIVLRIFDVPADKHEDWICDEREMSPAIDYGDYANGEVEIEPMDIKVTWNENTYLLFRDGRRVYSFNEDYIKPLLDEPDYLSYYKRETPGGGFILALKIGMELMAIVAPAMLHEKEKYSEEMKRIGALYEAMERESVVSAANEMYGDVGEETPRVDPETGEVLEEQVGMFEEGSV